MLHRSASIPVEQIPIEDDGYHVIIRIRVNGKIASLLIDSGASRTVFDKERILHFVDPKSFVPNDKLSTGLGTNSMKTMVTPIKSIQFGELKIRNFQAILLDLTHVNESYRKLGIAAIDGVLGSDLLVKYKAVMNFGKKELKLKW